MQQLSGLDALFVRCEVGNTYLHIGPVLIYSPSSKSQGVPDFKEVRDLLEERLGQTDVLRRKLLEVPWKLDKPYWIEDQNFRLKNHVRKTRLRKPGNKRQLCSEIARLHSIPLDRKRPLWMAHVIYGLDDVAGLPSGSFAIYLKTHHASMDGTTSSAMIATIHDQNSQSDSEQTIDQRKPETDPSTLDLLSKALVNNIRQPFSLAGVAGQALGAVQRIVKGSRENRFTSLGWRERTRFNGSVSPDRVVGYLTVNLAEVKQTRRQVPGATVNDVMLTVVSGGLRRYLLASRELPEKPLVAGMPVNVRSPGRDKADGNVLSVMTVSLCTDIENPLQRLECVHQQTVESKAYHDEMGPELVTNLTDSLPQYLVALCTGPVFSTGLLGKTPPIINTVVSNVPGPQEPLYFGGAKMEMISGLGPCTDGLGLFHSVSSYCEGITIGFQACPIMLPDPEFYTRCIQESWDDLKSETGV
jgi:WS/DGAT/MGAT family acyltransferase